MHGYMASDVDALISALVWSACAALCAPLVWLAIEVTAGLKTPAQVSSGNTTGDSIIVIPAHDEAFGLAAMLRDLPAAIPRNRVLLVADNCADETAQIGRAAGVSVIERHDPARRGKGYALAFARDALAARPPASVIILDADCRIQRGNPFDLAVRAVHDGCAVQAENLQTARADASPLVRIGAFAFLIKNVVRARGLERLGGSAFLQGTGMALPWDVFARMTLATRNPVEDMELTIELARMGVPTRLDSRCRIVSAAAGRAAHLEQRTRWEQGFIRNGLRHGPGLIAEGLRRRTRLLAAIGCHMCVPPLALLFLIAGGVLAIGSFAVAVGSVSPFPVVALGLAGLAATSALIAGWVRAGQHTLSAGTLALAPLYILWKLPVYLTLPFKRTLAWTRTRRFSESNPSDGA